MPAHRTSVGRIIALLAGEYGVPDWQPDHDPLSTLVQTILSQNTSDTNSRRAFRSLRASLPRWDDLAAADVRHIATAIRSSGLEAIKAVRIKQALAEIALARGRLELGFLARLPLAAARDWLVRLPGVGSKTASCVLLFSLGMPALPVDTHVLRVAKRLGLVEPKASAEKAQKILEPLVPSEKVYPFHVLMIEHGRRTCKARRPLCRQCTLVRVCPSYERFTSLFPASRPPRPTLRTPQTSRVY